MGKAVEHNDPFMELLTDALRAGPGSPEWHQAVGELRKRGGSAADEYSLLWTARERLASGKEYRSVKAGAGFTRKVMEGIERLPVGKGQKARSVPVAAVIALASVLVLVGVVAVVGYWMYGSAGGQAPAKEDLSSVVFIQTVVDDQFADTIQPSVWTHIGGLPVTANDGLHAGAATSTGYTGGGVLLTSAVSTGEPFAVDVELEGKGGEGLIPQVFVTDQPQFHLDRGTGSHELVWTLQDGQAQVVLPDGHVAATWDGAGAHPTTTVHVVVGRDSAIVQTDGRQLWAGSHGLGADRPRYVGVRFLAKAGAKGDVVIKSVRVQTTGAGR